MLKPCTLTVLLFVLSQNVVEIEPMVHNGRARPVRSVVDPAVPSCGLDQWMCTDGQCIKISNRCNNFPDCADESDERNCTGVVTCVEGEMACQSGECISTVEMCDGVDDCADGSDEHCENGTSTDSSNKTTTATPIVTSHSSVDAYISTVEATITADVTSSSSADITFESTTVDDITAIHGDTTVESTTVSLPDNTTETLADTTIYLDATSSSDVSEFTTPEHLTEPATTTEVVKQTTDADINTTVEFVSDPTITVTDQSTDTAYTTLSTASEHPVRPVFIDTSGQGRTTSDNVTPQTTSPTTAGRPTTTMPTTNGNFCMRMPDYGNFCRRRYRGYYRHPTNCSNFIMCEWGLLYLCRCPFLTVWDTRIENCVWAFLSIC